MNPGVLETIRTLSTDDAWVMVVGSLVNVSCGLLGCYLVLRRQSLLGDAISHAILPGLAVAFMLTHSRAVLPMFLGAMAVGVLTAFLSQTIHRVANVPEDASMGVVFTTFFAVGVILITMVARHIDLDPGCVLYGAIEFVGLDMQSRFGLTAPRAFWSLAVVIAVVVGFIVLFYKELKIVSFDAHLATTMGINATLMHYLLMSLVAGTTVAAFESVGSILVVAMLIVPGATAHLLTDRLDRMLMIAAAVGIVSAIMGNILAVHWNTSVAGMMSVVAGLQFATAVVAAPRYGLISRWLHHTSLASRVVREDILAMIYRWHESTRDRSLSAAQVVRALGGGLLPHLAMLHLRVAGLVGPDQTALRLTRAGRDRARGLVRSHRLWESYLAKHFDLPIDHLHEPAERVEHFVSPTLRDRLAEEVIDAKTDPHGRRIPP
ncbi:MAG: iron chelate uptake ABC transporter family permease subunit [Phycisphaerales bacterium]|nr:iron chelate uptake ABC transporter family permease subunit [Phycisphaerales bacterium]